MKIKIIEEENENPVLHEQCGSRRELMKSLILARIEFQQKQFGKRQLQKNWQGLNLNLSNEILLCSCFKKVSIFVQNPKHYYRQIESNVFEIQLTLDMVNQNTVKLLKIVLFIILFPLLDLEEKLCKFIKIIIHNCFLFVNCQNQ